MVADPTAGSQQVTATREGIVACSTAIAMASPNDAVPGCRRLSKKLIRFPERKLERFLNGMRA